LEVWSLKVEDSVKNLVGVYAGRTFPTSAYSHLLFWQKTAFVELITHNLSLSMSLLANLSVRLREFTVHRSKKARYQDTDLRRT
jgi:hypothetical protein